MGLQKNINVLLNAKNGDIVRINGIGLNGVYMFKSVHFDNFVGEYIVELYEPFLDIISNIEMSNITYIMVCDMSFTENVRYLQDLIYALSTAERANNICFLYTKNDVRLIKNIYFGSDVYGVLTIGYDMYDNGSVLEKSINIKDIYKLIILD